MIIRILKEFGNDETYTMLKDEVFIGRESDCDIVIHEDLVSRKHARITYDEDAYWLEDLNSTNGTYVNGTPVDRYLLQIGDKITIGKAALLIQDIGLPEKDGKPLVQILDADRMKSKNIISIPAREASNLIKPEERASLDLLKKENETLKKLFELNNFITATRNIDELIEKILKLSFEMINADTVSILLSGKGSGELEVKNMLSKQENKTVVVSRTVVNHVLEKGHSVLSSDAMDDTRFEPGKSIFFANIKSAICTPIRIEDRVGGIFYADMRSATSKFSEDDLKIVTILANMVGIAIENDFWHKEAMRKERLSAIGQVITSLSHYAKNILNGLKLAIQTLEVSLEQNSMDRMRKSLKAINSQEKRISNLVLNMLDYSKDRVPVRQKIDLSEVIRDIADPYAEFFKEKNISFILDSEEGFPQICVDVTGIHRVLLNLFTNALDAIKHRPQGVIKVTLRADSEKKAYTIVFEDNGMGISKKYHAKIFEIFYSTKGFEGTGLGLAVVKKILAEHNGTISVESEPDMGAKFIITLPME